MAHVMVMSCHGHVMAHVMVCNFLDLTKSYNFLFCLDFTDDFGTPWVSSGRYQESVDSHERQHGGRENYLNEVNQVWSTINEHLAGGEWQVISQKI